MSKENLRNKGITLIALIITIVVMLILTGVTLSIILGDNGLVNKAKTASDEMQKAMDKEELLSMVMGAYDAKTGNIDSAALVSKITAKGWTFNESTTLVTNGEGKAIAYLNVSTGAITDASTNIDIGGNSGPNVEIEEVVDLSGTYYQTYDEEEFSIIITPDNKYSDSEDDISNADMVIDKDNKTITISYSYEDASSHQIVEGTKVYKYDIIMENGVVVNKVLICDDKDRYEFTEIYWQNTNGFTGGPTEDIIVSGEYRNSYGSLRYVFHPGTLTVDKQSTNDGGTTWQYYYCNGPLPYFWYKGECFTNGHASKDFSIDNVNYESFIWDSGRFDKIED